jgi:hypothetical protein
LNFEFEFEIEFEIELEIELEPELESKIEPARYERRRSVAAEPEASSGDRTFKFEFRTSAGS